ncbi:MAG: hypothetical protein WBI07_14695 [Mobilitalea sp.]
MKKNIRRGLTAMMAFALVLNFCPTSAQAAADTAFLAYVDESWTYQYWGEPVDTGVVATEAEITGAGTYTVSIDFTKTADGKASGLTFTAPMIANGEAEFPGGVVVIDSMQVNGVNIPFTKGYTSSDDAIVTRSNIYNTWVTELPADARTLDGSLKSVSAIVVDPELFAEVETFSVTFTLYDAAGNNTSTEEDTTSEITETTIPHTGVSSLAFFYGFGAAIMGFVLIIRVYISIIHVRKTTSNI